MGTQSLVAVIGFLVTFGVINSTLNKRNNLAADNTYGYVKYAAARDIARSSIQIALRRIDTTKVIPTTFTLTGTLDGGQYTVIANKLSDSTLRLTATSKFNDSTYRVVTTLLRRDTLFPARVFGTALGLYPSPVDFKFKSTGGEINGMSHDSMGVLIPASPDSVPPISVRTSTDSTTVRTAVGANINSLIGTPKINVDTTIPNANTFADMYKEIADTIFTNTKNSSMSVGGGGGGMLGSPTNPIVVFCDGKTTNNFNFQGEGWGILVVRGNLKLSSNSIWHGLIIVYGNAKVQFDASVGNSTVIGGVLLGGLPGSEYALGGGSKIKYSKSALQLAKAAQKAGIYLVVEWYE